MSIILSRPKLNPHTLKHITTALHYCLGCYSSEVCDRYREDYIVSQKYASLRRARPSKTANTALSDAAGRVTRAQFSTARNILGTLKIKLPQLILQCALKKCSSVCAEKPHLFVPKPALESLVFAVAAVRRMRGVTNATLPVRSIFYVNICFLQRGNFQM